MACLVHTGSYATIDQASNALFTWLEANNYHVVGPNREVYLRFSAAGLQLDLPGVYMTDESTCFVTELQVPVDK